MRIALEQKCAGGPSIIRNIIAAPAASSSESFLTAMQAGTRAQVVLSTEKWHRKVTAVLLLHHLSGPYPHQIEPFQRDHQCQRDAMHTNLMFTSPMFTTPMLTNPMPHLHHESWRLGVSSGKESRCQRIMLSLLYIHKCMTRLMLGSLCTSATKTPYIYLKLDQLTHAASALAISLVLRRQRQQPHRQQPPQQNPCTIPISKLRKSISQICKLSKSVSCLWTRLVQVG